MRDFFSCLNCVRFSSKDMSISILVLSDIFVCLYLKRKINLNGRFFLSKDSIVIENTAVIIYFIIDFKTFNTCIHFHFLIFINFSYLVSC